MKTEWLQSFEAFAEHLNFTHAARSLHLSQPALHAQITRLTEELGVPLYRRVGRRLELTPGGERTLAFARLWQERRDIFLDELHAGRDLQPVVLAAGEGAFLYLLGPAIRRFRSGSAAPLTLLTRDREGVLSALRTGRAHLGVAPADVAPRDLHVALIADVPMVVAMPATHPLARRHTLDLAALEAAPLIVPPEGRPLRATVASAMAQAGVAWEIAVEATGWPLMLHFVALGLGLAIVNGSCRMPDGLVARPLLDLPRIRYHLLKRAGAPPRLAATALEAALLDGAGPSEVL